MRRCRGCGKFAREDAVCAVCGKPPAGVYGLGRQMNRWDDLQREVWRIVVEMGIRRLDEYVVWER